MKCGAVVGHQSVLSLLRAFEATAEDEEEEGQGEIYSATLRSGAEVNW